MEGGQKTILEGAICKDIFADLNIPENQRYQLEAELINPFQLCPIMKEFSLRGGTYDSDYHIHLDMSLT